jgi:solute carrier family 25, member 38
LIANVRIGAGGISGFASAVILQPFDLVKTRLQQDNALRASEKRSIPHIFKKIWIEEGKLGLWKGTGATLAR